MADSPLLAEEGVLKLTISSNGQALEDSVQIVSVSVNKSINKVPSASIVVLDGDMPEKDFPVSNKDTFKPGAEIEIQVGYGQKQDTIFKGVVVRHSIKISGDNYARLVIECRDKAVAMTVGRKNTNYVNLKDSDIMQQLIAKTSGLTAKVSATKVSYKELVQYYCSDWDYMLSRAEANGFLVTVDDAKVNVAAPDFSAAAQLKVGYGDDLMEFHAQADALSQLQTVQGTSWDQSTQNIVQSSKANSQQQSSQGNLKGSDLAEVASPATYNLQTCAPMEQTALDEWAKAQQNKAELSRLQGRMKFQGSAKAKPNTVIELQGVGERFSGNVYITAVTHDIADGNWLTEAEFGLSPQWFAERRDLIAPPASGLLPGVEGLHIGVVIKLDEDPDKQYRVQVKVPVLQAETEGIWARLAGFYASDGIGAFFIPEIDDEVILGYINNDPSYPVILGSLYSSKRKPPEEITADNFIKEIVTRSELKISFDDEKKVITIITPEKNKMVFSDEDKSILIQDQNDNKVELSPSGISLDSPKDITISAKGKVSIDAMTEISLTAKTDVNVKGMNINNTADIGFTGKGNATAELSAAGETTVKGAIVMIN